MSKVRALGNKNRFKAVLTHGVRADKYLPTGQPSEFSHNFPGRISYKYGTKSLAEPKLPEEDHRTRQKVRNIQWRYM